MSRTNLARYRMGRAEEIVKEAEDSFKQGHFSLAVNRSYYAMFTSAKALLALKELDSSKHSGVISLFNRHLVKTGIFPERIGKFLPKAKDMREEADYRDFVKITQEDAKKQIDNAEKFVEEAERTLLRIMENAER